MDKAKTISIFGFVLGSTSFGILLFVTRKITERGIYADAHRTSGYIPTSELILLGIGLSLSIVAVMAFFRAFKHVMNTDSKKTRSDQKSAKDLALWSLICAFIAPLIYWFAAIAIILGIRALVLGRQSTSSEAKYIKTVSIFAVAVSILAVVSAFTTK